MTPVLVIDCVDVRHARGDREPLHVLRRASMEVCAGELAGVWAKASGGKTTLLEVAAGVVRPDSGRVVIDGHDLASLSMKEMGHLLLTTFGLATRQGPSTALTPVEWIELALLNVPRRQARRRAYEVLDEAGLGAVGRQPWQNLSDSEKARTAVARATAAKPKLLLIDDPTAGLDLDERVSLIDRLRSMCADDGVAVVITASHLADLQGVATLWSLSEGTLTGPPRAQVVDLPRRAAND